MPVLTAVAAEQVGLPLGFAIGANPGLVDIGSVRWLRFMLTG